MKKSRLNITTKLAAHVSEHYRNATTTQFKDKVICPTCFNSYDYNDSSSLTDGHIIPRASGGNTLTILCKNCNSKFGANQDKWLGEYLNLILDENFSILNAKTKGKYLEVNGERMRGEIGDDGAQITVKLFSYDKKQPPKPLPQDIEISVQIPLSEKQQEIKVGFLTAAYLLWFKQFGYSWAFQNQLSIVREQIDKPSEEIIKHRYIIELDSNLEPCVGVLEFDDDYFPAAIIYDHLVVFPNVTRANDFAAVERKLHDHKQYKFGKLDLFESHSHPAVIALAYKDTNLIFPDTVKCSHTEMDWLLFLENEDSEPKLLQPMKPNYEISDPKIVVHRHRVK